MGDPSNICLLPVKSETVTCPNCKLMFNDDQRKPCLLTSCGHTICHPCSSSLRIRGIIKCPKCWMLVGGRKAKHLPFNYELMSIAIAFSKQDADLENQEELLNDIWDTKEKTVVQLDSFCKNMAPVRDQLLDTSIKALQQSVVLLSRYFEASELYQNATKTMNQVQELSGNEYTNELKEKFDCINSVLEHIDDYQIDLNTVNTERIPTIKLKLNDGCCGELKMEDEGLHLYCFTDSHTPDEIMMKMANVDALYFSEVSTTVFLDVAQGDYDIGRIYMDIFESRGYAKLFISLCLGSHGPSLKGTKFGSSLGTDPNFLFAGVYEDEEGKQCTAVPFEGINIKDIPCVACNPGSIIPRINFKGEICTKFLIFLKEVTTPMPAVGNVYKGIHIVYQITEHLVRNQCVVIKNCGVVLKRRKENVDKIL